MTKTVTRSSEVVESRQRMTEHHEKYKTSECRNRDNQTVDTVVIKKPSMEDTSFPTYRTDPPPNMTTETPPQLPHTHTCSLSYCKLKFNIIILQSSSPSKLSCKGKVTFNCYESLSTTLIRSAVVGSFGWFARFVTRISLCLVWNFDQLSHEERTRDHNR